MKNIPRSKYIKNYIAIKKNNKILSILRLKFLNQKKKLI